ncbi:uncharacterized protein G2W53_011219 [Senna tora]|uniref:Uncharacterized protein n=1 Tax=Senna tora TaxID=362788 RepID=A0A834X0U9_9FABA|nr:uncharacterized protein G2W53_011219 [Senna tora]
MESRTLQEGAPENEDITTEEEDQLDRSTKKVKRDGDLEGQLDLQMSEAEHIQETSGCQSDSSNLVPEEISDERMVEAVLEIPIVKPENGILWKPDSGPNLSYKEKLLGDRKQIEVGEEAQGPWMYVQRFNRRKPKVGNTANKSISSGEPSTGTGSRFQALAQMNDKRDDKADTEEIVGEPSLKKDEIQIAEPEKPNHGNQTQGKARGLKVKTKKMEIGTVTPKKPGAVTQLSSENNRKNTKQPHEKAADHIVVTSVGATRKQHTQAGPAKSPTRSADNANKAAPKALTDVTRPKQKKPPDFNESLHLIKMAEKEMGASGMLLPDLGFTQVYDNMV